MTRPQTIPSSMSYIPEDIFNRSELIFGENGMKRLYNIKVIIFGIGGVGSWTAEALIRTGVKYITIVDADKVASSNINRQVPATTLTIGQEKVEVMKQHLLNISPQANITACHELFNANTAESFQLEQYDYIIDAIDSLSDKALLIHFATRLKGAKFFSSMGAALKIDPTKIAVENFHKVQGCRLAAALRRKFKTSDYQPAKHFKCVYSPELLPNKSTAKESDSHAPMTFNKVITNGSLCHITAIFGMTLAGLILEDVYKTYPCKKM